MFLKKLEISGFKSFAARTALDFSYGGEGEKNYGVTVIVGPNGSGKSNIADAVRWVMGEQSMKNLRGKKSEDVIFAGSGKKTKLGSAKVTLYFDNSDKKIPLDFSEVSVSRKLYRSGESEYLINGSKTRLQDVADLLAASGVGKQSYAIINQGMADAVLNSSPLERRSIIEDAAGVKLYQIKKERSARKLDSTRDNLEKVEGILKEIEPHLKSLKRQADKAAQGEEVSRKLKEKQLILYSFLWKNFEREKSEETEKKDAVGRDMMNIQRQVDKIGDELGEESKKQESNDAISDLEKKQREIKNNLNQLDRELIVSEGRIEIEKERQKSLAMMEEIRIKSAPAGEPVDLSYAKSRIEEIRIDQENLIKKIENIEKLEDLQDVKEFARVVQQKLYDLRSDIERGRLIGGLPERQEKNEEDIAKEIRKSKEVEASLGIISDLQTKTELLREEIGKQEKLSADLEKKIQEEAMAQRDRRKRFFELERMLRQKQDELNKFKDRFNEAKIEIAKLEVREEDLLGQIKSELRTTPEDLPEIETENINTGELTREIFRLKGQLEHIGGIDPMVVEEYQETKKRFEFLTNESSDLEKAIVSLKEVVKEMDQKIKESFDKTFLEINKEFSKYFKIIFGGGHASLLKKKEERSRAYRQAGKYKAIETEGGVEDGNIGETDNISDLDKEEREEEIGIDILANPPGKRISNLSMLSGGERSLTSLALLFAIISHNPPPFSILDEVEAALDEANSRRFGRILTELSQDTQFVIITHNRETMRQASLLYGVTMGEDGISKLLSVRLDQVGAGGKILK